MCAARRYDVELWTQTTLPANWTFDRFQKDFHMSRRQAFRLFHDEVGMSPRKWLKDKRMKLAVSMLPRLRSVKRTSAELGYKQPTHFCRDFKSAIGVCPSELIKPARAQSAVQLWLPFDSGPGFGTPR